MIVYVILLAIACEMVAVVSFMLVALSSRGIVRQVFYAFAGVCVGAIITTISMLM